MKKRLPIIIGVVWLLLVTAWYGYYIWNGQPDGIYTYENDGCVVAQTVYVADNEKETGFIYQMDLSGNVQNFFSTSAIKETLENERNSGEEAASEVNIRVFVRELAYQQRLYAVLECADAETAAGQPFYVVLELDETLQILRMTPQLFLNEADVLSEFSLDDYHMYLTAVSEAGDAASVYQVELAALQEIGTAAESLQLESFLRKESKKNRSFVDAAYYEGKISVRTDANIVSGVFAVDDSIRFVYAQCHMNADQLLAYHAETHIYFLIALAGGWVVLAGLWLLLRGRNRVMYVAVVVELVLAVVVFGGTFSMLIRQTQLDYETQTQRLTYVLSDVLQDVTPFLRTASEEDFYSSENYEELTALLEHAKTVLTGVDCKDLFFADTKDYEICASVSGRNRETVEQRYFGANAEELMSSLVRRGKGTVYPVMYGGVHCLLLTETAEKTADSDYALFALYEDERYTFRQWRETLMQAGVLFLLASVICILILAVQAADFRRLAKNMQLVAKGRTDISSPRVCGSDMRMVWSALGEIQKKIRSVNYSKYRAFEAYYRFAPKNIEKLLNKESITEVASGNVASLNGTMAMIATVGPKSGDAHEIERLNYLFALLGRCQEEKDGVFISNDGALSMLRFLFMEKNKDTVRSTAEFLKELEEADKEAGGLPNTSVLLHHTSFVYGVAGTAQQSSAFLISQEIDEIERFADWFRQRGLRLVISETVKEREIYNGELRCIGYIHIADTGQQMKMYEALDVYDARERAGKLNLREKFAQALQLFYQHDFYLARSAFSDVLKELPTDEIAKWYLFTCESYLNREHADDLPCSLNYEQ